MLTPEQVAHYRQKYGITPKKPPTTGAAQTSGSPSNQVPLEERLRLINQYAAQGKANQETSGILPRAVGAVKNFATGLARTEIGAVKDVLGMNEPGYKSPSFVGGIGQNVFGSKGLASAFQLPGRVAATAGAINAQNDISKTVTDLSDKQVALAQQIKQTTDPVQKQKLTDLFQQGQKDIAGIESQRGEFEKQEITPRQVAGNTLRALTTAASGLPGATGGNILNPKLIYDQGVSAFLKSAGIRSLADASTGTILGVANAIDEGEGVGGTIKKGALSGVISGVLSGVLSGAKGAFHGVTSPDATQKLFESGLGFNKGGLAKQELAKKRAAEILIKEGGGTARDLQVRYNAGIDQAEEELGAKINQLSGVDNKGFLEHWRDEVAKQLGGDEVAAGYGIRPYPDLGGKVSKIDLSGVGSIEGLKRKIKGALGPSYTNPEVADIVNNHLTSASQYLNEFAKSKAKSIKSADVITAIKQAYTDTVGKSVGADSVSEAMKGLPLDLLSKNKEITAWQLNELRREITNRILHPSAFGAGATPAGQKLLLKTAGGVMADMVKESVPESIPLFERQSAFLSGLEALKNVVTRTAGPVNTGIRVAAVTGGGLAGGTIGAAASGGNPIAAWLGATLGVSAEELARSTIGRTTLATALRSVGMAAEKLTSNELYRFGTTLAKLGIIGKFTSQD